MILVLKIAYSVLVLGLLAGSIWYVPFRLSRLLGLARSWPLYVAVAVNKLTIKEELPKIPITEAKPVVLMHHSPVGLEYISGQGIELMLSGHTHAGQVFPATLLTPLLFPLNKGLHVRNGTHFFVSQGAGTYGPRMRLGSSNEINLIRLKSKN